MIKKNRVFILGLVIASQFPKSDSGYDGVVSSLFEDDPFFFILYFVIVIIVSILKEFGGKIKFNGKSIVIVDEFEDDLVVNSINDFSGYSKPPDNTKVIEESVQLVDPNFNTGRFIAWAKEVFMKLNVAWTQKDHNAIRPFEHEILYSLHTIMFQEFIDKKRTEVFENVSITEAYLYKYDVDSSYEHLTVLIDSECKNYTRSDLDGTIISGDFDNSVYETYLMTFMRKLGIETNIDLSNKSTSRCPNCGGPTNVTSFGKCEYCQTVITTGDHDWVMTHYNKFKLNTTIDITPVSISSEKYSNYVKYEKKSTSSLLFLRNYTKDEYVLQKVNEELKRRDVSLFDLSDPENDSSTDIKCPDCNTMNDKSSEFCSYCEIRL